METSTYFDIYGNLQLLGGNWSIMFSCAGLFKGTITLWHTSTYCIDRFRWGLWQQLKIKLGVILKSDASQLYQCVFILGSKLEKLFIANKCMWIHLQLS